MSDKDADDTALRTSAKGTKLRSGSRRASAATSTISQHSDGSSKSKPGGGPLTPESPQVRITRKRAAETAIETEDAERPQAEHGSPTHARGSSGDSGASAKSVCLCQPDPKIPRPRNGSSSHLRRFCSQFFVFEIGMEIQQRRLSTPVHYAVFFSSLTICLFVQLLFFIDSTIRPPWLFRTQDLQIPISQR